MAELLAAHPRLSIRLTLTDRIVRLVEEGIDVAVRIADLPDSSLRATRIGEVRRVLVANPAYLVARGIPADVGALHDHDLIAFEALSAHDEWRFKDGVIRLAPRLLTNHVDAAIEAALLGRGIARTLDYQVRDHLESGRLMEVLPDTAPSPAPINIVHCANRHPLPGVRAFLDVARRQIRSGGSASIPILIE